MSSTRVRSRSCARGACRPSRATAPARPAGRHHRSSTSVIIRPHATLSGRCLGLSLSRGAGRRTASLEEGGHRLGHRMPARAESGHLDAGGGVRAGAEHCQRPAERRAPPRPGWKTQLPAPWRRRVQPAEHEGHDRRGAGPAHQGRADVPHQRAPRWSRPCRTCARARRNRLVFGRHAAEPSGLGPLSRGSYEARGRSVRRRRPHRGIDLHRADRVQPAAAAPDAPTFAKDVAPIVFNNCATCHRHGEVAPMTLLSYERRAAVGARPSRARSWSREMPPWGADTAHTLKMRNDRQPLAAADRHHRRVGRRRRAEGQRRRPAAGAEVRRRVDATAASRTTSSRCRSSSTIPAEGELGVQMFYSKVPFTEDRFAEVVELRPGNRAVVHHAGIFVVDIPEGATLDRTAASSVPTARSSATAGRSGLPVAPTAALPGSSKLLSWVPGRGVDRHRADIGKRIPAGKYINWQMHYNPTGKPEKDRTRLGIWFNKVPVTHEVLIRQAGDPLATTKGGLSLYRAEGKEVEYIADASSTRRRSTTPNIPPYVGELEADRHHAGDRGHHALRDVAAHAPARQEPEVGRHLSRRPRADDPQRAEVRLQLAVQLRARRTAEDSRRQQDLGHRRLRQLAEEQVEPGSAPRGVLVASRAGTRCTSRSPSTPWTART